MRRCARPAGIRCWLRMHRTDSCRLAGRLSGCWTVSATTCYSVRVMCLIHCRTGVVRFAAAQGRMPGLVQCSRSGLRAVRGMCLSRTAQQALCCAQQLRGACLSCAVQSISIAGIVKKSREQSSNALGRVGQLPVKCQTNHSFAKCQDDQHLLRVTFMTSERAMTVASTPHLHQRKGCVQSCHTAGTHTSGCLRICNI